MKIKKIVLTALFAALTLVSTIIIRIPSSTGYIHMGDAMVLLSAYLLGPVNGAFAAGIGSALADITSGYTVFAVPTLIIKALVAFTAGYFYTKSKSHPFWKILVFVPSLMQNLLICRIIVLIPNAGVILWVWLNLRKD